MRSMTSKERMLTSLRGGKPDHIPCSFMAFFNLHQQCPSEGEFLAKQVEMGLDAYAQVGYLEPSLHPEASEKTWTTREGKATIFHRRIDTPKGPLTQQVVQEEGWPQEGDFWRFNDWIVPRCREMLVKPEQDLEKLPYLLGPFDKEHIRALRESAKAARAMADHHQVLLAGGWSSGNSLRGRGDDGVMGADAMAWLSGYEDIMVLSLTQPEIIREYARIIHEWNLKQLEIYLDVCDAELIIRRAWYETTEFWTPAAYRTILAPFLKREVDLVHQAGRLLGLITTSAFLPILDDILDTGIDVLIGLDPEEGKGTNLVDVKARFRAKGRALWGGVSGAITVEQGTREETEQAVQRALDTLGPDGGFILSPVDNVRVDTPGTWDNTRALIEAWKRGR
jgi:uroporphyrinogen-III decarboxylase